MPKSKDQPRLTGNKRSYSELRIDGLPMFGQGTVSEKFQADNASTSHPPLDASRSALLVVDVQPEYWSACPAVRKDFPNFPARMASLIEHCRSQHTKIIWVRADYSFDKSPWLQQFSRLHGGSIPPVVTPNSKWEDFAEPLPDEHVILKSSWSSTSDTDLLDMLREDGIDTVMVSGLITSVCVQHSAFGVFEAGFRTMLVTDACADRGKARHDAALALYGDYMYELQTVETLKEDLRCRPTKRVSTDDHDPTFLVKEGCESVGSLSTMQTANLWSEESDEEPIVQVEIDV